MAAGPYTGRVKKESRWLSMNSASGLHFIGGVREMSHP